MYNAINILLINFTKAKIYSNSIDNPDEIETYFLGLLDYNFPQNDNGEDEIFVNENDIGNNIKNDDKMDESDNNKNENEKEVLQKEFNDQYVCFKMMFYFLTQKDLKENTINGNLVSYDNDDNNINNIENKDNIYLNQKEKGPYKNTTFTSNTSNNKIIESENNIKNKESKGEFTKKIKNNLTNPQCSEKLKEGNNISFYSILKNYLDLYFNNFIHLLEKNLVKPPFLPELDTKRYKYTLVLDLDETLVHYMEEENSAYVQVRPYADYFLKELSKFFEIVLFTAAEEDYTDIVLKELNKNNYITHILCRKYTELNNGSYLKDLSKLGRDLSKVVIVDNNKDNFRLQPENGLFISSYFGEQNDNELYLLCGDLMKIIEIQPEDIRPVIKEIDAVMQNRYAENMYVLQ